MFTLIKGITKQFIKNHFFHEKEIGDVVINISTKNIAVDDKANKSKIATYADRNFFISRK